MPSVKPFRGLRFVPSRVDLGAIVAPAPEGDPRHVGRLLDDHIAADDGRDGPLRRARLRLAEWRRAGVLARDGEPALYAVRRRDEDGTEALGLFCAVAVDAAAAGGTGDGALGLGDVAGDPRREARLEQLGVAVEPVVAAFAEARVRRTLENAVDREADASWRHGETQLELWCIDDESTAARLATLLSTAELIVERGEEILASHASFWRRRAGQGGVDDDRRPAASFALAFLHPADEAWPEVPVGGALLPLAGQLE